MTRTLLLIVISGVLALGALGQPGYAANAQQEKMTSCNAEAKSKGLSGSDRKTFMKSCLSAGSGDKAGANSQQTKMKSCNADAKSKGLKGDERKKFMSECLKGT